MLLACPFLSFSFLFLLFPFLFSCLSIHIFLFSRPSALLGFIRMDSCFGVLSLYLFLFPLSLSTIFSLLFQLYLLPRSRYLLFNHFRICWTCLGHYCHSAQPMIHLTNSMALFGGTKWHSYATCWHPSPPALSSTTQ